MGEGRWAYVGLRFDGSRPAVPADWTPTLRAATGFPDLDPEVLDVQPFTLAAEVATAYRAGPGFLVGDAAHRTTPVAGIGLNTAIHDGHELGWKLAWAARGLAGDALLASHDAERGPVGLAAAARSLDVEGRPTDGLPSSLGHTHRSTVIAGTDPAPDLRIDLAARPGERAPHAWVRHAGRHRSTLDLFDGGLTLLTGADGRPWARAAAAVAGRAAAGAGRGPGRARRGTRAAVRVRSRLRGARAARRARRLAARRRLRRPDQRPDGSGRHRTRHRPVARTPEPHRRLNPAPGPGQNRRCSTSNDRAGMRSRPPGLASRSLRAARARRGSAVSTTTCHIRP